ncbi:hypothetical protein CPB85DRAFT_1278687 [Mucidula mucida]|nr:hypothetical protein CPB85DRAFT_1278687 [Mucidula mucida]
MNFVVGDRVFFWDARQTAIYGTVTLVGRMADGSQLLTIQLDVGASVQLPASGVTKRT